MPIATLISGFVFAFVTGWLMTLVILATLPALAISGGIYVSLVSSADEELKKGYAKAAGRVEQALSGIKTIKQLNGETYESELYNKCLEDTN